MAEKLLTSLLVCEEFRDFKEGELMVAVGEILASNVRAQFLKNNEVIDENRLVAIRSKVNTLAKECGDVHPAALAMLVLFSLEDLHQFTQRMKKGKIHG